MKNMVGRNNYARRLNLFAMRCAVKAVSKKKL
jgi:hypothetical protein